MAGNVLNLAFQLENILEGVTIQKVWLHINLKGSYDAFSWFPISLVRYAAVCE